MTEGFFHGNILRGLAAKVLFFLTLTLLPIGITAVVQTRQIADQSQVSAELSLLAVTQNLTRADERLFQEAFGAAEALGTIVRLRRDNLSQCSEFLREYKIASGLFDLIGFIGTEGIMSCTSSVSEVDLSADQSVIEALELGGRRATTITNDIDGKRQLTVVTSPVMDEDMIVGLMAVSIPHANFDLGEEVDPSIAPVALTQFNQDGAVLATNASAGQIADELPANISLAAFSGKVSRVFHAENQNGIERAYAVSALVPNAVYALGVWPSDTPLLDTALTSRLNLLLPIIMWLASLIVAFWAINRLAITHIRKLGRQMRRFAFNRTLPRHTLSPSVPTELVHMESNFIDMAESILRDEATLEDGLREKNILLKEVHHRVKNNLQLISSIMNMQIRQAEGDDAKFVLKRLQQRILSLATVHENLYKDDNLERVDANTLLSASVNQLLSTSPIPTGRISVTQNYEHIVIDPDDAAPLTLLVSETVTNALKYVNAAPGEQGEVRVILEQDAPGLARLTVENTAYGDSDEIGPGLGSKLINAFARQLNGEVSIEQPEGLYRLIISFQVPETEKPILDY